MKKYNQKYIKVKNKARILELLIEKGPFSRAQIAKEIGITRSTVSEITNEMVLQNIVLEGSKIKGNLGKRPTLIYFNKDIFQFIALVITNNEIDIVTCNLFGEITDEKIIKLPKNMSAKQIMDKVFNSLDEIFYKIGKERICLISVGSPETLNIVTGRIEWSPYVKDWIGIDLKNLFKDKYGVNIIIKDHVKLETIGEQWKSFNSVSNLVYITITKGIGSGIIIDGKIREGKNGFLGEIAFLPISVNIDYGELKSGNSNLGYFESKCDIDRVINLAKIYCESKNIKMNFENVDAIARLYKKDKDFNLLIADNIIKNLALGLSSIIIILNPEIVVINGEIIKLGPDFLGKLKLEINSILPFSSEIVFSSLKNRSRIFGAIKNGLDYINYNISLDPNNFFNINA